MKKLVSVLSLALVGGVLATQPVLAQGTQQKPAAKAPAKKEAAAPAKKDTTMKADTAKKAVKHHKKHSAAKKPAEKKPSSEKPGS